MKTKIIRAVMFLLFLLMFPAWAAGVAYERPKLILQITVDQLRGDLPTRYYNRLGEGGLRYLLCGSCLLQGFILVKEGGNEL